jgi:hypothetical protein
MGDISGPLGRRALKDGHALRVLVEDNFNILRISKKVT